MTLLADCWFHGEEPITPGTFRVCGECGHTWTAEALLAAHNAADDVLFTNAADMLDRIVHETDPDKVFACPLCIHDF